MRAGTTINIIDNSTIQQPVSSIAAADTSTSLFAMLITSDKGTEQAGVYMGQDFFDMFGSESTMKTAFKKHGQPLLQAANIINAGGKLFVKRLVAEDATLANVIVVAKVHQKSIPKVDHEGKPLYTQPDGSESTNRTEHPVMLVKAIVKYELVSAQNAKTLADVKKSIANDKLYKPEGEMVSSDKVFSYPLFIITDNGRGVSSKKIRFASDYVTSKNLNFCMNTFSVFENGSSVESTRFTMNPNVVYKNTAYELEVQAKSYLKQVKVEADSDIMNEYIAKVAELANIDTEEFMGLDILSGRSKKGEALDSVIIDEDSADITSEYGIDLTNGSNGAFGDRPFGTSEYTKAAVKYLDGTTYPEVCDRATYKISLWLDANYPDDVKRKLEILTNWRKDGMYLGDMGTEIYTYDDVYQKASKINRSFYNAHYCTAYEVYDPYSKKAIPVTMLYSLAPLLVEHMKTNPQNPMMGEANSMIITDVIEGSVRFTPVETMDVEQKSLLEELRVNYATYVEGRFVPETGYTSQLQYTQLSFANNVIALQEVGRALRTSCPPERYKLLTGDQLKTYEDVCKVTISAFEPWFNSIDFVYTVDPIMKSNKIFNASVSYSFYDFYQTEQFDFYAINAEE